MKLLWALMIWSHGICFASAAASSSAAVDVKTAHAVRGLSAASDEYVGAANRKRMEAGAQERRDVPGTFGEHSAAVVEATGLPASGERADISRLVAEYAYHPQIPDDVAAAIYDLMRAKVDSAPKLVTDWIMSAPENINGIEESHHGRYENSLLNLVIQLYGSNPAAGEKLLRMLLDLNPNVRYKARVAFGPPDALWAIFVNVEHDGPTHIEFIHKIIDLLLEQGTTPQEIEKQLGDILGALYKPINKRNRKSGVARRNKYVQKVIHSALEHLRDIQAAPILEEELTKRLGIRDLGRIGREYIEPAREYAPPSQKQGNKTTLGTGKSGGGK